MELQTDRLTLRKLAERDIPDLFALDEDPEVWRFIDGGKMLELWPAYEMSARRRIESFSKYGPDLGFWAAVKYGIRGGELGK